MVKQLARSVDAMIILEQQNGDESVESKKSDEMMPFLAAVAIFLHTTLSTSQI